MMGEETNPNQAEPYHPVPLVMFLHMFLTLFTPFPSHVRYHDD